MAAGCVALRRDRAREQRMPRSRRPDKPVAEDEARAHFGRGNAEYADFEVDLPRA